MKIITVSGKAESGKSTVADFLVERLRSKGFKAGVLNHADSLKLIAERFFGWNGVKDEEGRRLLQELGTDVVRAKYPDAWVNIILEQIKAIENVVDFVVVADARFLNELNAYKSNEYETFNVLVSRENHRASLTAKQQEHLSEKEWQEFPFEDWCVVSNDGSLEGLHLKVCNLVKSILEKN